jgi:hypothetical protein
MASLRVQEDKIISSQNNFQLTIYSLVGLGSIMELCRTGTCPRLGYAIPAPANIVSSDDAY